MKNFKKFARLSRFGKYEHHKKLFESNAFIIFITLLFFLGLANNLYAQPYELSEQDQVVKDHSLSPDSTKVVYLASQKDEGNNASIELYSVPLKGGKSQKINVAPAISDLDVEEYVISQDSSRVIYVVKQDIKIDNESGSTIVTVNELYSVPVGGGASTKLHSTNDSGRIYYVKISPDSSTVVYTVQPKSGPAELYSIPIDGGTAAKLYSDLGYLSKFQYNISNDSENVVFKIDGDNIWLYSIPIGGGTAIELVELNDSETIDWTMLDWDITPDSSMVVYSSRYYNVAADTGDVRSHVFELYSLPIDGGEVNLLDKKVEIETNNNFDPTKGVFINAKFLISPDSQKVVYSIYLTHSSKEPFGGKIFSKPIKGGDISLLYSGKSGRITKNLSISKDSKKVLFEEISSEGPAILISNAIDGGSQNILSSSGYTEGPRSIPLPQIAPDSRTVVFGALDDNTEVIDLFSIPISGGTAKKLNEFINAGCSSPENEVYCGVQFYQITSDYRTVVYTTFTGDEKKLMYVPIRGGSPKKIVNNFIGWDYSLSDDSSSVVFMYLNELFGMKIKEIETISKTPPVGVYILLRENK